MTDPSTTADAFVRGSSNGYVADLAAIGSIETVKDLSHQLNRVEESLEDGTAKVAGLVTDSSFRALEQFGLLGVQVQKTTGELMTASVLNAKDGIIDSAVHAAAAQLQAEKIASAAVLLATQIAATAAAKAAECCCELKEKIGEDGDETRELINAIERRHADRREGDLKTDLSNLRQTNAIERLIDERLNRFTRTAVTTTIPPV